MDPLNAFQESVSVSVTKRRIGHRKNNKNNEGDDSKFTSKNLEAERRRRQRIHSRLLALRSHVPVITNMKKATIVDDAITYIQDLQMEVENLSKMLHEMEVPEVAVEEEEEEMEMKPRLKDSQYGIGEDVHVSKIGESKFWLKIISGKKAGIFTKITEAMSFVGFEIIDISITTFNGVILVSSSVQGIHEGSIDVEQMRNLLVEAMRNA
ncbi:PREDICTED: transcription factor DYT1-like [Tarenaya hassleriana]|uniref:transcription factor DYT1-like n=1 Tax=Tarenaya hassleriana TaxID=28532 RepID=UPI00053C925E|nr:PREDICTED: transcription factor DYT1-like [Tarenaya hassleriana]